MVVHGAMEIQKLRYGFAGGATLFEKNKVAEDRTGNAISDQLPDVKVRIEAEGS